jgi:integrase
MNFSVYWNPKRGNYEARFRSVDFDTKLKVPDKFWKSIGLPVPDAPTERHDRMAVRWAARRSEEIDRERRGAGRKMTLRETFDLYVAENPRGVSAATIAKYRVDFANLERTIGGATLPEHVDDAFATSHRNVRREEEARERTIGNELAFLKQLLTFAYRWKRVTGMSEMNLFELPRIEKQESLQVALTEEQFVKLLTTPFDFHTERNRRWLIFGVCTMLRRENLLGLRKEWVNRAERWMYIPAGFMKEKRAHDLPRRKFRSSHCTISAPPGRHGCTRTTYPNSPARCFWDTQSAT